MDTNLQQLRRKYASEPSHSNAMELARALLRTGSLRHFREMALAGDVEAVSFLRYMRSQLLGGTIFEEIEDTIEYPMFVNTKRGPNDQRFLTKFVNVYCNKIPYAAVTVNMVDDAISVVQLLHHLYATEDFFPPPDPVEIDQSNVARSFGYEKIMIVAVYQDVDCKITVAIENQPCFNFYGDAFPVTPKIGRRDIQIRPVTEDDFESDDGRTSYKTISYEDLPDFAKPEVDGTPHYVVANLVTRGSVRDIDGPAWQDFYEPIAKVYVGYLTNYLLTQPRGWAWADDRTYTFTCEHTALAAQAFADSLGIEGEGGYIPVGAARRLEACPLAGVPQFLERRPRRSVCPECGSSVSIEVHESSQLGLHEDAVEGTPEPPTYVNRILDFLQRLYQDEIHGDINSVLGGQELSVYLTEGNYGPIVQQ